ncbi:ras-GEF domain-containing family member 1B-B-like [Gadus chalcogrammus]|uniref:ras-GEF domain-containing family member 1B-B-like n=1 Tax=Gadus chalcogrammus TaxID=1042646 RepID=UPI0024C4AD29|nr:ras-GEF domain-containing family member 1B-B-like [Gadus chalcogrammus]
MTFTPPVCLIQVRMPPTTPYAGKFGPCSAYNSNNNHPPPPRSPYRQNNNHNNITSSTRPCKDGLYDNQAPARACKDGLYDNAPARPCKDSLYDNAPARPCKDGLYDNQAPTRSCKDGLYDNAPPRPCKDGLYDNAYTATENPYDIPQPCSPHRTTATTTKHHVYNPAPASPVTENPYSTPHPVPGARYHHHHSSSSTSCSGRLYRNASSSSSSGAGERDRYRNASNSSAGSDQSYRSNSGGPADPKEGRFGNGITASYGEMCYHDNSLVSGSLEALIQHLVPTVDYYPDRSYVFTFLLSSRLFLHPYELMSRVCHLCVEQQRSGDPLLDKIRVCEVAPKLVQLLTEWTETFPYDFRDERMMRCLKDMTHHVARGDEYSWRAMQQMTQRLIKRLSALGQYEEAVAALSAVALERPASLKNKLTSAQRADAMSVCDDPFVLAQQLTHIELDRLSFIGPEEFIQTFALKDPLENHKGFFRKRKTSNLEAYVNWFNRLSYLVATEICLPVKKKHRARAIEFFIDVAQECFNIGNFNSLMAIITGMNMSPVSRLKKTWSKVNTDKFDILEHQMDPSSNFSNYRTALRGATQRSETAHSSQERIVIPFFSLLIKDIYFLNEGCASRLTTGHINFEKLWELAKQVSEFLVWRQVVCPFQRDRRILQFLVTSPVFNEDELHLASYESEGPENHMEKDSRRSLRSSLLHRENRS